MARVSMGDVWDDTREFVVREHALLLPLAFATFGLATLILMIASPPPTPGGVPVGPWMIVLIPVFLLMEIGYLATSFIALRSAISVREALERAIRRLVGATVILVVIGVIALSFLIAAGLIGQIIMMVTGMALIQAVKLATVVATLPILWLVIRLTLIWASIADRRENPMSTIRSSLEVTRRYGWQIAGVFFASGIAYVLITIAVQLGAGTVLLLIGRSIGRPSIGETLLAVLLSAVAAGYLCVWTIFRALLYRRLSASMRGI